jgi:enoyl-[acyl-carrier protein] reductase/trans-2-enoyl-CoA reductase (NAD+)
VSEISIEPSSGDIDNTVAVMGRLENVDGWQKQNLGATTVAYSYIGPSLTEAVYRKEQLVVLR